jgi:antitoxin (DNA-binding transcriptional repressor) of toxin-antitoxin stability system
MNITISKSKLKTHILQLFRELEDKGGEIIVTDRDRPVIRIHPLEAKRSVDDLFASWRGEAAFIGDPDEPTIDEWSEV